MRAPNILIAAAVGLGCAVLFCAEPAFAYVTCNMSGDCWKTDTQVKWPGVTLLYHDDNWWDENKNDQRYRMRDVDDQHNWRRGYWENGRWYKG